MSNFNKINNVSIVDAFKKYLSKKKYKVCIYRVVQKVSQVLRSLSSQLMN